jgi:neutral trehalase
MPGSSVRSLRRALSGFGLGCLCACTPVAAPSAGAAPKTQALAAPENSVASLPYESPEQVRYRLLEEQDTDCDQKITTLDQGSRRFRFRLQGQVYDFTGNYALSNVLQELTLARQSGGSARLDRVNEDPVARTSRLIRTEYWSALERRLDEDGLPGALDDPKVQGSAARMLYVPNDDARALGFYRNIAQRYDKAYAELGRAVAGLGAAELGEAELGAMLRSPEGRESVAELSRRLAAPLSKLDYPGLARHLMGALSRLGDLLEQAGRSCVNTDSSRLGLVAKRAQRELAQFSPKTLSIRELPDRREWASWSANLGSAHGLLSLALDTQGDKVSAVPFVVPGGRFNEMYGWDSYFILRGLVADERLDLARGLVDNGAYVIEHYGATLNANRTYYLTRSQPPFFASMVRSLWEALPRAERDPAWLARMLRAAVSEYSTVWGEPPRRSALCAGDGPARTCLDHYAGLGHGQPPEVEPGHFDWLWQGLGRSLEKSYQSGNLGQRNLVSELDTAFKHDRCMRESGHDTTYRWFWSSPGSDSPPANRCADMISVDLNSLLYKYEVDMAFLLGELGAPLDGVKATGPDAARRPDLAAAPPAFVWCARARNRLELMKRYLWSARDGLFYDALLEPSGATRTGYVSATTLYPLYATSEACGTGNAANALLRPDERSLLVTNALGRLEAPGGLLASDRSSRDRFSTQDDRQWDYPNGWAPHQMLAWYGLEAHGFRQDAERLISSWLFTIASNVIDHNGTIPEKYDVMRRTHAVFAEYGNVGTDFDYITREGFGWMNASFEVGLARLSAEERRRLSQSLATR